MRKKKLRPDFGLDHAWHQFRSTRIRRIFPLSSCYSLQFLWIHEQLLITLQICDSQYGIYRVTIRKNIKHSRNRKIKKMMNKPILTPFS